LIEALGERFGIAGPEQRQLRALVECVATDSGAPTSVTDRDGILRDHVADSLVGLELPEVRAATTLADLGSGAGFPGLPLAIALPQASISLVESNGRKCAFLTRTIATCAIPNACVVNLRAEEWRAGLERCDVVLVRAVAPLPVVAEYAAPLLRIGGTLVAWRGRRDPAEEQAAQVAARELGLEAGEPRRVRPYPAATDRHLQPFVKVAATPARFPRRPGIARKRPLGSPI
jgi:16S rRNA (guanine527-N7)-methyltransferase